MTTRSIHTEIATRRGRRGRPAVPICTAALLAGCTAGSLALGACAITPPVPVNTSAAPTPSPAKSSVSPTPTPTPSAMPTPTPTMETSLTLRGDGIAMFTFGAKQVDVADVLKDRLGDPDTSSQGILCPRDGSPWAQTVIYGRLWVHYTAEDQSKKSSRSLAAWGFGLDEKLAAPLAMQDGVPLNLNFNQLKAKYPAGKLENPNLDEGDGHRMFTLPNKLRFVGVSKPEMVLAGQRAPCE